MTRETYQRHLREIQDEVLVMGSMVEKALDLSMQALKGRDLDLARRIVEDDKKGRREAF